ncbi:glycoside hydrolase family 3 C-terminal domain-containing protein [Catenulispora yoronensis]|uniref:Glycoside hydrolase family 3 C-terminal domain-containing protein n=1 Tax=Catenulispora yoronensis TaxID=450799 RepID=A0ABP5FJ03_9ACTN
MTARPADPVLSALTLEQKAALTSGADFWHTEAVPAAGVPSALVADGPHGLRKQPEDGDHLGLGNSIPATCFPPAVALACSWDPALVRRVGAALGAEAASERVSVLLGPGVNIKRSPLCGRNFEYYSEDPFLTGRLGAAFVDGVQSRGVGTSLKHFAANNQETDRMRVSAEVDERTLREIYLAAFEHVVTTAKPTTVMSAYNKLNGVYATEHSRLLTEILRGEWGFDGAVVSDWGAVADRVASLAGGTDLQMPPDGSDDDVVAAVRAGRLDEAVLDQAVRRLLGVLERTARGRAGGAAEYDRDAHHALAHEAALSGAVLLKNADGVLPLAEQGPGRIAVIGEFARTPRYQGAGSSQVVPTRLDDALAAVERIAGADRIVFEPGFRLDGVPDAGLVADAVRCAAACETAVLFLGLPAAFESEGFDRADILLPADQQALLAAVHAANPRTVVVLSNGGVVSVADWESHAAAVLEGWLLGQAGGSALADLLFGRANPAGHLTETIPLRLQDVPSYLHFPGGEGQVVYGEGVFVGYRGYDTAQQDVAYPFGHGLSYTEFDLSALNLAETGPNRFTATFTVTNTGPVAGAVVPQVYVHDVVASVARPEQELKGFARVHLAPGESTVVRVGLDERAFAYWSTREDRWKVEAGIAEIRVGLSSRDVRLREQVRLPGDGIGPVLDASSTLDEWLDDGIAAAVLDAAGGPGLKAVLAGMSPGMRRAVGAMPMRALAVFGLGFTGDSLPRLLDAYTEARNLA